MSDGAKSLGEMPVDVKPAVVSANVAAFVGGGTGANAILVLACSGAAVAPGVNGAGEAMFVTKVTWGTVTHEVM